MHSFTTATGLRCLFVASLIFVVHSSAYAQPEARIAAWNLAANSYFNDESRATIERKMKETLPRVAAAIETMNPDVIAFTEVESHQQLKDLAKLLKDDYDLSYQVVFAATGRHLNMGVLAKRAVKIGEEELISETSLGSSRLRDSLLVPLQIGDFDFELILVHLKSGTKTMEINGRRIKSAKIREMQCKRLAAFINERREAQDEQDILVIGDYNMFPRRDTPAFENLADGSLRFITNECLCRGPDLDPCFGTYKGGNMLDGFAISTGHTKEYKDDSLWAYQPKKLFEDHEQFRRYRSQRNFWRGVSDHLPIMARFSGADLDD